MILGMTMKRSPFMQTDFFISENSPVSAFLDTSKDNPERGQMESDFFGAEGESQSFVSFLNKTETDPPEPDVKKPSVEQTSPFLSSFLLELIYYFKNTLISIKNLSFLSIEKANDLEFKQYAQKGITEDIKKIDSVLNSLLNYIHINTPIIKKNTISIILEEILEANEKQILSKKIKIIKKCEKDLPETFIHDEQVRFILSSVLQYAILLTPPHGAIGFLIKCFDFQSGGTEKKISPERNGSYIEAAMGFTHDKGTDEPLKEMKASSALPKEETLKLILKLVEEILQKNRGSMTHEVDPKKPRTLITLRFPIERRKVVYYEPISI